MLLAWGFDRVGVVAGDLYFIDPDPAPGQEGPEHGVRLEVRLLARPPLTGSVYAAQPIVIDRPVWRADLLETVGGEPGSRDRTHHHPRFRGWEPGARQYDGPLSADPLRWLQERLEDLPGLLAGAQLPADSAGERDAKQMAAAAPRIVEAVRDLLERVRAGELGTAPEWAAGEAMPAGARVGWL
ncbi:MAG TPA: hypothetical protein VKI19_12800 [Acidimicrobiales bacterium]|nr:hypothetical protein [Acidimicrobiales bacterium]